MKRGLQLLTFLGALLTSACTQVSFTAVNFPTHFDDVQVQHDLAYGPRADEKLDIYQPSGTKDSSQLLPVVVFYYGGRWETGSKENYHFVGSALAKQNFIVVIPDYRKYPGVKFPAFVEDAAAALAWTADHISAYGGDPNSIHIAGHSAGGHIASLLATDPRYLNAYGKDRSVIKSFAGLASPYDFIPDEDDLKDMFGPPTNYPNMQATSFVDGKQPPMLLLWGEKDTFVGRQNMDKLAAAIHEKGGCVITKTYPSIDHIWILGTLSWMGNSDVTVLQDMNAFFKNPEPCGSKPS